MYRGHINCPIIHKSGQTINRDAACGSKCSRGVVSSEGKNIVSGTVGEHGGVGDDGLRG